MPKSNQRYFNFNPSRQPAGNTPKIGNLKIPVGNGARAFKDELGDVLSIKLQGAGITLDAIEATVNFDYNSAFNANPALADYLYKNVQLNHDRNLAAVILPHLHWFQEKDYSPNFLFEYRWQINGGLKVTAWTKLKSNTLAFPYTVGTSLHQISYSAGIAVPVGTDLSDIVQFRVYRDTSNISGEFTGNCPYNTGGNASAKLMAFDVHFELDSIGSTEEYVK